MSWSSNRVCALALGLGAGFLSVGHAQAADTSAESKAAARELATDGIKLAQAGNCKEALPKLEKAESLYHAVTILTWVGECQIKEGRLVEGTENLNKVVREELPANSPQAFSDAKKRASSLVSEASPRIGRLTLTLEPANVEKVEITIDGRTYPAELLGAPRPTDPGHHEVVAKAPGYKEARGTVDLQDAAKAELKLAMVVDPSAPVPVAVVPVQEAKPEDQGGSGSTQRTLGWIGIGVGGAAMIAGGITGIMAIGAKGDLSTLCPSNTCGTDAGIAKLDEANTLATTSTILFGAGGALVATGVILLITGGPAEAKVGTTTLEPRIGLGQVGLAGSF